MGKKISRFHSLQVRRLHLERHWRTLQRFSLAGISASALLLASSILHPVIEQSGLLTLFYPASLFIQFVAGLIVFSHILVWWRDPYTIWRPYFLALSLGVMIALLANWSIFSNFTLFIFVEASILLAYCFFFFFLRRDYRRRAENLPPKNKFRLV